MNWQDITVCIVGALVVAIIAWRVISAIRKRNYNPCGCCDKECPIKELKRRK